MTIQLLLGWLTGAAALSGIYCSSPFGTHEHFSFHQRIDSFCAWDRNSPTAQQWTPVCSIHRIYHGITLPSMLWRQIFNQNTLQQTQSCTDFETAKQSKHLAKQISSYHTNIIETATLQQRFTVAAQRNRNYLKHSEWKWKAHLHFGLLNYAKGAKPRGTKAFDKAFSNHIHLHCNS